MQLGCTKKLLDALKLRPTAAATADPFYSWSASITTLNRRKMLAVMNDACFCGFVLYGMKAKDMKNLQAYVLQGIRALLESYQYEPGLIERYMQDCGSNVELVTTRSRSTVARLNCFTRHAIRFADEFSLDAPLQKHLIREISFDFIKADGDYQFSFKLLEDAFIEHYHPEKLHRFRMIDLSIDLQLERPSICTRRVLLPQNATLSTLHEAIQRLFSWEDYHLHEFMTADGLPLEAAFPAYAHLAADGEFEEMDCLPIEQHITLEEAFTEYSELCYIYDFGDDWQHTVRLNGFRDDAETGTAHCLMAVGDAPPEDVGGSLGYEHFLKVMNNPDDDEYENMKRWAAGMIRTPLSVEEINMRLKYIF